MSYFHGTSLKRWKEIQESRFLKRAPCGDLCVSMTSDLAVAHYFADLAVQGDLGYGLGSSLASRENGPIVLVVETRGLNVAPFSSLAWGENGECDWERETAYWEDIPICRVSPSGIDLI